MRLAVWAASSLGLVAIFLLAAGRDAPAGSVDFFVHYVRPVAACTSPGADDGAYGFTGYKLKSALTYQVNQKSFPSYLNAAEVQAAIQSAFATWDGATGASLFTNGGTTTNKIGFQDGVNAVGFRSVGGGTLALTYGWVDRKTKLIKEIDIALATNFNWATNGGASGDCGGAAGAVDVLNIITHEVGHSFGLADLTAASANAQTMYGYAAYRELFKRDLASGDVAGVRALYGP